MHLRVLLRAIQCAGASALWLALRVKREVWGGLQAAPDRGVLNISTARLSVAKAEIATATAVFAFTLLCTLQIAQLLGARFCDQNARTCL